MPVSSSWKTTVLLALAFTGSAAQQAVLGSSHIGLHEEYPYHRFNHTIKRVAVVGAGPAGLQAARYLVKHNFTVRLFERAPEPGGNWAYSDEVPVREPYPDEPLDKLSWVPEKLPAHTIFNEGDEGLTLSERWREHWAPRPVWDSLHTNSPAVITELADVPYSADQPWVISNHVIGKHVRAYASMYGLNSNDKPSDVIAYSTRVERVEKAADGSHWTLTLRHLKFLEESHRINTTWWTEDFDAIVVATGPYDAPHVPEIDGLLEWSKVKNVEDPSRWSVYHSRVYRKPQRYTGKTVLVVGVGTSGSEIARDIAPYAKKLYASHKPYDWDKLHPFQRRSFRRFPSSAEFIGEIKSFGELASLDNGIVGGKIYLKNGTVLEGVDEIILATGYKRTIPSGPDAPPPDVFDGARLRNVHWTGHYIADPTLAFTNVRPWTIGPYQSYALAKVWEGTARLPNQPEMWRQYNDTRWSHFRGLFGTSGAQAIHRQYVTWINNESLEHGGPLVDNWPVKNREIFSYYANKEWEFEYVSTNNFTRFDELPADKWTEYDAVAIATEEDVFW
ncbi:hypothetical protein PHLGIDRAFT_127476 [Phlebiopsis gigantea 11061_1 CR5-6]|uniref:FAD/NAD(P)-binding domain-containing protein n=1 Tax=Phlebiopsis gigantea (strain 11061_1 CR5-6) TaxID=745531 RepID=A0A0C3S8U2_PHLG1|nr:hypothetical protein PHLGIDRAFT_127476 [Phlebiopsis gigantea 11061_1 CR5-6]